MHTSPEASDRSGLLPPRLSHPHRMLPEGHLQNTVYNQGLWGHTDKSIQESSEYHFCRMPNFTMKSIVAQITMPSTWTMLRLAAGSPYPWCVERCQGIRQSTRTFHAICNGAFQLHINRSLRFACSLRAVLHAAPSLCRRTTCKS